MGFWTVTSNHQVITEVMATFFFFTEKLSVGWFLKIFLGSEYFLYTLSVEIILVRFCWLTCRKQRKILQKRLFVLMSSCHFRQAFAHYFMSILVMQTNRWIHLSNSLWGIPLHSDLFWKQIDQKIFLL